MLPGTFAFARECRSTFRKMVWCMVCTVCGNGKVGVDTLTAQRKFDTPIPFHRPSPDSHVSLAFRSVRRRQSFLTVGSL